MIIVTGATGKLGQAIVERLLKNLPSDQVAFTSLMRLHIKLVLLMFLRNSVAAPSQFISPIKTQRVSNAKSNSANSGIWLY